MSITDKSDRLKAVALPLSETNKTIPCNSFNARTYFEDLNGCFLFVTSNINTINATIDEGIPNE